MRVININHYPIDYNLWEKDPPTIKWQTKNGKFCAIWDGNWSQVLGNEILYRYPEIKYEVWRPDVRADQVFSYNYQNGMIYRLFPATKIKYFLGIKRQGIYFSNELVNWLEKYIKYNDEIILHINAAYRYHDKLILDKFYNKIPIISQFYTNPLLQFEINKTANPIKILHRRLIRKKHDDYYFKNKFIIPSTQKGLSIFKNLYNSKIFFRDNIANFGIDFDNWEIRMEKSEARNKLNIETDILMFFCSSRLVPEKQIDKMIKEFAKINNKSFKIYLSGNGEMKYEYFLKDLTNRLGLSGKLNFIGFVGESELKLYYKACDVFISTSKSESGPFSTALAALYEIPIITTNTGFVYELLKENDSALFIDKDNPNNWHKIFNSVINGFQIKMLPKSKIKSYFDWDKISKYYIDSYKEVINIFYKN